MRLVELTPQYGGDEIAAISDKLKAPTVTSIDEQSTATIDG